MDTYDSYKYIIHLRIATANTCEDHQMWVAVVVVVVLVLVVVVCVVVAVNVAVAVVAVVAVAVVVVGRDALEGDGGYPPSRGASLCPATVSLTPRAGFNGI